uniref:Putative secreted protein n=1 Tax=Amblyomma cajennense TaxID=34607 RepID=A0A023FSU8_AMBCJ
MEICKALLFLALVAFASAVSLPNHTDPRCQSSYPPLQTKPCPHKSFVYYAAKKKCVWTCGRGPFVSRNECDRACRTPAVCNWQRPFETCVHPLNVYYFDKYSGRCLLDNGGCSYAGNNFPGVEECRRTCKAE